MKLGIIVLDAISCPQEPTGSSRSPNGVNGNGWSRYCVGWYADWVSSRIRSSLVPVDDGRLQSLLCRQCGVCRRGYGGPVWTLGVRGNHNVWVYSLALTYQQHVKKSNLQCTYNMELYY